MPGRKKLAESKLFKDVSTSDTKVPKVQCKFCQSSVVKNAEIKSSRTHFEVLGLSLEGQVLSLGLEASSPRKLACPRLEDSTFFELLKFCRAPEKKF